MLKNSQKGLLMGLMAVTALTMTGGTAYLAMSNSQYLASLFGSPTTTTTTTTTAPSTSTEKTPTSTSTNTTTNTSTAKPPAEQPKVQATTKAESIAVLPLFSLYGTVKPSTKTELCAFLDSRLKDTRILAPRALHRYNTDFDLHCVEKVNLHSAAPENHLSVGQLGFLSNARSGLSALLSANNVYLLFGDHTQTPDSPTTTSTSTPQ